MVKPEDETLLTVPATTWPKGATNTPVSGPPGTTWPGMTRTGPPGAVTLNWARRGTATICLLAPSGPRTAIWAADGVTNPVTDGVVSPVTETATMAPASAAATIQPATRLVSALPSR